jgi:hypothetical protein
MLKSLLIIPIISFLGISFSNLAWSSCPSTINFGETVSCSIGASHEQDSFTFSANAGDVVTVLIAATSGNLWPGMSLLSPGGNELCHAEGAGSTRIKSCKLPSGGIYTILVLDSSFNGSYTGNYNLSLERLNPGSGPRISYIQQVSGTLLAGDLDSYTFSGNAGDKVALTMSNTSGDLWPGITLYGPDGSELCSASGPRSAEIANWTLLGSGIYTILVYDSSDGTLSGDYNLFLGIHPESITTPDIPLGPKNGKPKNSYYYFTEGSQSSLGHPLQYLFDWGDGTNSGWVAGGNTNIPIPHSWSSAGRYFVKVQARCSLDPLVVSDWSGTLEVWINPKAAGCDVIGITPKTATFPAAGGIGQINVTAPEGCAWDARTDGSYWFELLGDTRVVGNGVITYWLAENVFEKTRKAEIRVYPLPSEKSKTYRFSQLGTHWEHWQIFTLDAGPKKDEYGRAGRSTSIALDSNDKVHIAYYSDSENAVKYITNVNNQWEAFVIDSKIDCLPDITIRVDNTNKTHIVYNKCNKKGLSCDDDLYYATNKSGVWQTQFVDYAKAVGRYSSMAIDSSGQVHIAYGEAEAGYSTQGPAHLKYAKEMGNGWFTEIVDSGKVDTTMIHMSLDHNDKAHISYMDYNTHNLRYSTNVGGSWQSFDLHEGTGQYNAIGIDSKNSVHIFHAAEAWGLWYTTNASGSWTTKLVRDDGNWFNSLAIDSHDVMHISSFDGFNLVLKYMKIDNGVWERYYVDLWRDTGRYNALAIDSKGNAHISYHFWSYNKEGEDIGSLRYATNSGLSNH